MAVALGRPVEVGDSKYVHVRSDFYHNETKCGLAHTAQTYFRDTEKAPTCVYCIRQPAA